ncbi:hypothetical protein AB4Z22_11865 [Paenibacillus sp. TAF58]
MVKKIIIFIVIFFIISNFSSQDLIIDAKEQQSIQINKLSIINKKISGLYPKYGAGVPISAGIKELLNAKEGNCAQLSYLFARKVIKLGYDAQVIGLYSNLDGLNHLVVNVKINDKKYLFDPTNGVYYNNGLYEILGNPLLAQNKVGFPKDESNIFTTSSFFASANNIQIYENLNYGETNLLKDINMFDVITKDLFNAPNDLSGALDEDEETYTAGLTPLPNEFTVEFKAEVDFYRMYFRWYSDKDYATDFQVFVGESQEQMHELFHEMDYQINANNDFEYVSSNEVKAKYFKIKINKTNGQQRILLKDLGLYQ